MKHDHSPDAPAFAATLCIRCTVPQGSTACTQGVPILTLHEDQPSLTTKQRAHPPRDRQHPRAQLSWSSKDCRDFLWTVVLRHSQESGCVCTWMVSIWGVHLSLLQLARWTAMLGWKQRP